jgi:hypothetical protein
LAEYKANICFSVGKSSDTWGLYDEKMVITVKDESTRYGRKTIKEVDGWGVDSNYM